MSEQTIRDAMVPEPMTLGVDATAQDAGRCFAENDEVRALFVVDADGRLAGVLTRKTLVREVVAAGRSPADVPLREIAEPPHFTLDASLSLDTGFHQLEENDLERLVASSTLPLPPAWARTATGEPMPDVVAALRGSRAGR